MCVVCGCSGSPQDHGHDHHHSHDHDQLALDFGHGTARVAVPGMSQTRVIQLEADLLGANAKIAARNRAHFVAHGVLALNFVSSPGSGKTTLLCATLARLQQTAASLALAVIEGDQQTSRDADRIRALGVPAVQVNTGKGCHLDALMVEEAFSELHQHSQHDHHHGPGGILFIENVGNLVCPALFDLGERAKVAVLSVTEGDDKPLKYPDMFAAASLLVLNKIDLLPHVSFDVDACFAHARQVNPGIALLQVSATRGDGLDALVHWLLQQAPG
ncbi:MAG: hydrogenase nickel incorporation protein HypB [Polyangiales bacterium]